MKKIYLFLLSLILLFSMSLTVKADDYYCSKDTVEQMAKIVNSEVGTISITINKDENTFSRLNVASIILNNAVAKKGNTLYDKMMKFTDNNYQGYSTYKDLTFEEYVEYRRQNGQTITENDRGLLFYSAALILTGKYNVPKNIVLQAACSCFYGKSAPECVGIDDGLPKCNNETRYGKLWSNVKTINGFYDHYFGYSVGDNTLSSKDIYDKTISDTSPEYFKNLALSLELEDYTSFSDASTVCNVVNGISINNVNNTNSGSSNCQREVYVDVEPCENPDIVRVIYFARIILDIIKTIIPIGMVIMAIIDFSKGVTSTSDEENKKNMFRMAKRFLYAILIFAVPWIVRVVIVNLGNLAKRVNYTDCLENATSDGVERLQSNYDLLEDIAERLQECETINPGGTNNNIYYDRVILTGDSRTDQMCRYNNNKGIECDFEASNYVSFVDPNHYFYVARGGMAYDWYCDTAVPGINKIISNTSGKFAILSWFGVNGLSDARFYNDTSSCSYKVLANGDWKDHNIVLISVTPVDEDIIRTRGNYDYSYLNNKNIEAFNNNIRKLADSHSNITYCDIYSTVKNNMDKYKLDVDGLHYTGKGYVELYSLITEKCLPNNNNSNNNNNVSGTQGKYYAPIQAIDNYTFSNNNSTPGCNGKAAYHDIQNVATGTPVYAGIDGTAEFYQNYSVINGKNVLISYGNEVKLTSTDGKTVIVYGHLDKFVEGINHPVTETCQYPCSASVYTNYGKDKPVGTKKVKKGDLIGYVGTTGNSTGPHLHVEIKENGSCICDPFSAFGMREGKC